MKYFILTIALTTTSFAQTVEVPEIPDAFFPIPLTEVSWGKRTDEGDKAREACGGDFEWVGHRWEGRKLVHVAECE